MTAFTNLEAAVLQLVCETDAVQLSVDQRQVLKAQLRTAKVIDRDNTGHGFYTTFEVDRNAAPRLEGVNMIDAPSMIMEGLGQGNSLGFILWAEDGYPTTLEGFQNGDLTGQTVDLHNYDLTELRSTESSWG
jgi:hypothetical protein